MKQVVLMIIRGKQKEQSLLYWAGKHHALPVGGINLQEESQ
jgi:hypothetical protein